MVITVSPFPPGCPEKRIEMPCQSKLGGVQTAGALADYLA
jgi:hypothetical protein